jgi:hypothetical protein
MNEGRRQCGMISGLAPNYLSLLDVEILRGVEPLPPPRSPDSPPNPSP